MAAQAGISTQDLDHAFVLVSAYWLELRPLDGSDT